MVIHRHPGKYVSRKPKGGVCLKTRPIHNNQSFYLKNKKDIDLSWKQAHKKYKNLNALSDTDGDGKRNYEDCRPLDKKRQDIFFGNPESKNLMYTSLQEDEKEYIGKWTSADQEEIDAVANVIVHEELHNVLGREVGVS